MSDWNDKVIAEFRDNGGLVQAFGDAPMILMHTIGAKSGQEHVIPVRWFDHGEDVVVVASAAGAPKNPAWYHNLLAHPTIEAEVGQGGTITRPRLTARTLSGAEYDLLWQRITTEAPGFADYQTKTSRIIPLVAFSAA